MFHYLMLCCFKVRLFDNAVVAVVQFNNPLFGVVLSNTALFNVALFTVALQYLMLNYANEPIFDVTLYVKVNQFLYSQRNLCNLIVQL